MTPEEILDKWWEEDTEYIYYGDHGSELTKNSLLKLIGRAQEEEQKACIDIIRDHECSYTYGCDCRTQIVQAIQRKND